MATTRKRRRVVPGVLIATGIAGLGLAAASQLDLNWSGTFQDGVVPVTADCQPTDQPITVSFSDPAFASGSATTSPWTVSSLEFTGIADTCANLNYEVAVRASDTWVKAGTGTVPAAPSTTLLTVPLDSHTPHQITDVALTIYGDKA